ncbi:Ionotropic receptor 225 [Blattella germanica]|nr:Ionotropic receptor 225 [Blattella germanica]
MHATMTVADTYFIPDRTVVLSLPLNIVSEDVKRHLLDNNIDTYFEANPTQFVNNLLENLHRTNKWPILTSRSIEVQKERDMTERDTSNDDIHSSYILFVGIFEVNLNYIIEDVRQQVKTLEMYSAWNPRGKFVVCLFTDILVTQDIVREILRLLFNWEIVNVVVMVPYYETDSLNETSTVNVYTWFPYVPPSGSCGKFQDIVLMNSWVLNASGEHFLQNTPFFPSKVPNDLNGCPLRASTFEFHPFIICDEKLGKGTNMSIVDGLEIRLIYCLAEAMKMNLILRIPPGNFRGGSQLENGSWTGLRADIIDGLADIVFASLLSGEDEVIFDSTRIYFTDRFTWFVARAKPYPRWLAMARVFAPNTWFFGFLSIILGGIIMRVIFLFKIVQSKEVSPKYWRLVTCLTSVWAVFLEEGVGFMPRSTPLRTFFLSFVIYALAINTVFQAFFTSYIVNPGLLHQISDFDELVTSDLIYAYYYRVLDKFLTSEFKQKLKVKLFCDPFTCLDMVATNYKYATFCGRALLAYIVDALVKQDGKHDIYAFKEDLFQINSVMLVPKGSHLLNRFDEVMTYIVEAGLPNQWLKTILDIRGIKAGVIALTDLSDEYSALTMNHLQGAFFFLLMGIALGLITFILEVLTVLFCKKKKKK